MCIRDSYHTDQVLEKLSPTTRSRHEELEKNIFHLVQSIVQDAMDAGDLPKDRVSASDIVFGLWSLTHGAESLRSMNLPFDELGVTNSSMAIVGMLESLLDGLGWRPLSAENPVNPEALMRLRDALFKDELDAAQQRLGSKQIN